MNHQDTGMAAQPQPSLLSLPAAQPIYVWQMTWANSADASAFDDSQAAFAAQCQRLIAFCQTHSAQSTPLTLLFVWPLVTQAAQKAQMAQIAQWQALCQQWAPSSLTWQYAITDIVPRAEVQKAAQQRQRFVRRYGDIGWSMPQRVQQSRALNNTWWAALLALADMMKTRLSGALRRAGSAEPAKAQANATNATLPLLAANLLSVSQALYAMHTEPVVWLMTQQHYQRDYFFNYLAPAAMAAQQFALPLTIATMEIGAEQPTHMPQLCHMAPLSSPQTMTEAGLWSLHWLGLTVVIATTAVASEIEAGAYRL